MTTTESMLTALRTSVEAIEARATAADADYQSTREKVQETAWELGWTHGVGPVMEQMLDQLGLQPRPARVDIVAKYEVGRTLTDRGTIRTVVDMASAGLRYGVPTKVTQERESTISSIRLTGVGQGDVPVERCYCEDIERYTTHEQRQQHLNDYYGGGETGLTLLAWRCAHYTCPNVERTRIQERLQAEPEPF